MTGIRRVLVGRFRIVRAGLTLDGARWALTSFEHSNWHPITWLAYMLNAELSGMNPAGFHLASALWHAAATALLFLALRAMTGALWAPALAAALWALHPLRVESVAWAVEIKSPIAWVTVATVGFATVRLLSWVRRSMEMVRGARWRIGSSAREPIPCT